MRPRRVFVDARFVSSAPSSSHARYLRELAREWTLLPEAPEILLYAPGPLPRGLPSSRRVRWLSAPHLVGQLGRRAEGGRVWLNSAFTLAALRSHPDALFFPYPFMPRVLVAPAVVTIHDVCFRIQRAAFADGGHSLDARASHAMRSAAEIVAVSAAAKDGVIDAYGVDPHRVSVVHHGIAPMFAMPDQPDDGERRRALGVGEPYILCVSTHEARKNLTTLVRAFVDLVEAQPDGELPRLILVGRRTEYSRGIDSILSTSPRAAGATRTLTEVSDPDLAALYRGAAVVGVPSLCEGFGLPVLEALASGAPVLASDQPVFRELVGDTAVYAPPLDAAAWADGLRRLLHDPQARRAARAAAPGLHARFTWRQAARATLSVLERVAGRRCS